MRRFIILNVKTKLKTIGNVNRETIGADRRHLCLIIEKRKEFHDFWQLSNFRNNPVLCLKLVNFWFI